MDVYNRLSPTAAIVLVQVCPYHGWAFDEGGHLRAVPAAESDGEWPRKQVIDAFPVQEKVQCPDLIWPLPSSVCCHTPRLLCMLAAVEGPGELAVSPAAKGHSAQTHQAQPAMLMTCILHLAASVAIVLPG